jgi:hypothetical protein
MRWEVLGLGSAGFIGAAIPALVPATAVTGLLETLGLPPAALLVVVSALMLGLGQIGINPIVASSIVGGALVHLAHESVPPMALILTLMGPWTLYPMISPLAASTIMCARFADTTPTTVGWRWNGVFMVLTFIVTSSLAVLMTVLG